MKKEYNLKDKVWIHLGERTLTEGRVVEIIDLEHLGEGHKKDDELYIIEIKTGIDDVYEVRNFDQISPDVKGPINLFRNKQSRDDAVKGNRFMKKIGVQVPATGDPLIELAEEIAIDLAEPTPEQIHAAMERSQQATQHAPISAPVKKPKRRYPPRKKKV